MARFSVVLLTAAFCLIGVPAHAALHTFNATLTGDQETPPNASTATGTGTVLLDDVANTITLNLSWANLSAPASAAHIHGPALPGVPAGILFPLTGVPSLITGSIPEQTFAITPTQIGQLQAGLFYYNIHNTPFLNGEIRGQIVPEPSVLALLIVGFLALVRFAFWDRDHGSTRRTRPALSS